MYKKEHIFSIDAISAKGPFINDVTHMSKVVEHDRWVVGEGTPEFFARFTEANDEKKELFLNVLTIHMKIN